MVARRLHIISTGIHFIAKLRQQLHPLARMDRCRRLMPIGPHSPTPPPASSPRYSHASRICKLPLYKLRIEPHRLPIRRHRLFRPSALHRRLAHRVSMQHAFIFAVASSSSETVLALHDLRPPPRAHRLRPACPSPPESPPCSPAVSSRLANLSFEVGIQHIDALIV